MNTALAIIFVIFNGCGTVPVNQNSKPISHDLFNNILQKHVDSEGWVNYDGIKADRAKLNQYLQLVSANAPNDQFWTKDEQLAYWINAYNAYTIDLILKYYPLNSIRDIGSSIQVPFVNSPWDIKFIEIGDQKFDLNSLEHSIIREKFNEPRIHFAVNCASFSCPILRNEAYVAEKLDAQLQEQTIKFINDSKRNKLDKKESQLSMIFSWYQSDFTKNGTLKDFINLYSSTKLEKNTKISFLDYDWSLNKKR